MKCNQLSSHDMICLTLPPKCFQPFSLGGKSKIIGFYPPWHWQALVFFFLLGEAWTICNFVVVVQKLLDMAQPRWQQSLKGLTPNLPLSYPILHKLQTKEHSTKKNLFFTIFFPFRIVHVYVQKIDLWFIYIHYAKTYVVWPKN